MWCFTVAQLTLKRKEKRTWKLQRLRRHFIMCSHQRESKSWRWNKSEWHNSEFVVLKCCLQMFFFSPAIAVGLQRYFRLADVSSLPQIMNCLNNKCFSPRLTSGMMAAACLANTIWDGKIRGWEKSKCKAEMTGFIPLGLLKCNVRTQGLRLRG